MHRYSVVLFPSGTDTVPLSYQGHHKAVQGVLKEFNRRFSHTTHLFRKSQANHMDLQGWVLSRSPV